MMNLYMCVLLMALVGPGLAIEHSIDFSETRGHEANLLAAQEAVEKELITYGKANKEKLKSYVLSFQVVRIDTPAVLELALIGTKNIGGQAPPKWTISVAWRNILAVDARWETSLLDEVDFSGKPWRKNSFSANSAFNQSTIDKFWSEWRKATLTETITLIDWVFKDNMDSFAEK